MKAKLSFRKKKRHPKVPSSDLNHLNFNNMYWTPIQLLFYHVKLFLFIEKYNNLFMLTVCMRSFVVHAAINKRTIAVINT
ncbi:hypothetical protein FT641_00525 [Bacillus paranthracis]|nr:hypothetical protein [Bacillus paranthracis]